MTTSDDLTHRVEIHATGPFSLAASRRFLEGTLPIASRRTGTEDHVHVAFVPDGAAERAVGVCIRSIPTGVSVELLGVEPDDADRVAAQVARILSLDIDGTGFLEVGRRDPIVGGLQQRFDGLRPITFLSPYEAAAWFLMGQRIRMTQAAAIKQRMSHELGDVVTICGEEHHAFPGPAVLARLEPTKGLTDRKITYLRALAEQALSSDLLHGETIRALEPDDAIARMQALPGVGPFTAEGIVIRGAGAPDVLSLNEPRIPWAVQLAYGLDEQPDDATLATMSDAWRPFRSWVTVLLRVALESDTHEIATGNRPKGVLRRAR